MSRPSTFLAQVPLRLSFPAQWHVLGLAKPDPSAGHDELHHRASFYWLLFESDSQSRIRSVCREIEADGEGLNKAHRRPMCATPGSGMSWISNPTVAPSTIGL